MREESYWQRFWQRQLTRRRVLKGAALGGAGLAAAAVIGCGEEEKPTAATPRAATPGATATPAAVQPKKGGTLNTWDNGDPVGFDPFKAWGYRTVIHNSLPYPSLMQFKVGPGIKPKDYTVEPYLATSIEQAEETRYVIKLRPNAVWENRPPTNGRKITAQDIVYNWNVFATKHTNAVLLAPDVDNVTAPDESTVVFRLKKPLAPFVFYMGDHGLIFNIPPEMIEKDLAEKQQVGGGPFMMDRYEVGKAVYYKRNPTFWLPDRPIVDELIYYILPDPATWIAGYRSGALDASSFWRMRTVDAAALKGAGIKIEGWQASALEALSIDIRTAWGRDQRVRQAVSMSLDRDAIAKAYQIGDYFEGWNTAIPAMPYWWLNPQSAQFGPNAKYFKRDPAEAKKLMAAAGYPDGLKDIPFETTSGYGPDFQAVSELVQAQMKTAGTVDAKLVVKEFAAYYATTWRGLHKDAMGYHIPLLGTEIDQYFVLEYHPQSLRSPIPGRELLAQDTTLVDFIEKQRRELNREKRQKIVHEWQQYMAEKMWLVPSQENSWIYAFQPWVRYDLLYSYEVRPMMEKIWLDKKT